MKASGTSAPVYRVNLLGLMLLCFTFRTYAHFLSEWNLNGRCCDSMLNFYLSIDKAPSVWNIEVFLWSTIYSLTSFTLMVSPVFFTLLIITNFVVPSSSSLFQTPALVKVLPLPLSSNACVDINFPPFDFALTGTIWRNTACCFAVLDMHTFVSSSSMPPTSSWSSRVVKYDDVMHKLDENIHSLSSIYQHCDSFSGSWNTSFPSSPISFFQFLLFLHNCHICEKYAYFHRECTLVFPKGCLPNPSIFTIFNLLFLKSFSRWYAYLSVLCCNYSFLKPCL